MRAAWFPGGPHLRLSRLPQTIDQIRTIDVSYIADDLVDYLSPEPAR